ncbi:MAG: hypothetical protein HY692_03665, partial [Cyanobacteria bacterium NC_groundwater_1444_Ag_S-0.65um_54_12]|nr:hypothetical protein [Cyanobacteria bacterium NC_groundwater_1444_Ag_S-0.65um_54_12]
MKGISASGKIPVWLWPWGFFLFLLPFEKLLHEMHLGLPLLAFGLFSALLIACAPQKCAKIATGKNLAIVCLVLALHTSFLFSLDPTATWRGLLRIDFTWLTYVLATMTILTLPQ